MVWILETPGESGYLYIPCNIGNSSGEKLVLLTNTETKVTYDFRWNSDSIDSNYFKFSYTSDGLGLPVGEYEYVIDGNRGLLRIYNSESKKTYVNTETYKYYNG